VAKIIESEPMKSLVFLFCLLATPVLAASPPICPHNRLTCLERHMDDFYQTDPDRFFAVYKKAFAAALRCRNDEDVAKYLAIYSAPGDNAEIDEHMEQDTEALLLLKPRCLFGGFQRLTAEQQSNFVGKYRLFERPNHVMALLRHYLQDPKYKSVANQLYQANLEAYKEYDKSLQDADMSDLYNKYGRPSH
jgi:hypothetical protein